MQLGSILLEHAFSPRSLRHGFAGPADRSIPQGPSPFLQQLPDRALPWRALCIIDEAALLLSAAALHASQGGVLPTQVPWHLLYRS